MLQKSLLAGSLGNCRLCHLERAGIAVAPAESSGMPARLDLMINPGLQYRDLLTSGTVVLPGAFNAITARLAESMGFHAVYISGAGVTNSLTAMPDIALLTLTEMAQQCRYICNAVD